MTDPLVRAISSAARHLPAAQLSTFAARLESHGLEARAADPPRIVTVLDAGAKANADPVAIALALRAAADTAEHQRAPAVRLVATGPRSDEIPLRLTPAVVADLIALARRTVLLVTYVLHGSVAIQSALGAAAARGVAVELITETGLEDAADPAALLAGIPGARAWAWPSTERPEKGAALHAKAVVVDARVALVTSANLTGKAMQRNLELGVLVEQGDLPARLDAHLRRLMRDGVLVALPY